MLEFLALIILNKTTRITFLQSSYEKEFMIFFYLFKLFIKLDTIAEEINCLSLPSKQLINTLVIV